MPTLAQTAPWRLVLAAVLSLAMSIRGLRRGSLNRSGAALALVVGFISCAASVRFGLTLIAFFLGSSKVTRIGADRKRKLEDNHQVGGNRNWVQVAANGGWGTLLAFGYWTLCASKALPLEMPVHFARQPIESWIQVAYMCHYAACNADTWASELGVLSTVEPVLITQPWRKVPPGTNGGITGMGTAASAGGGLMIGLVFWLLGVLMRPASLPEPPPQWPLIILAGLAGLLGSVLDSILGATLQYSGWCEEKKLVVETPSSTSKRICGMDVLDNHQVNFLAAAFTSLIGARVCQMAFIVK